MDAVTLAAAKAYAKRTYVPVRGTAALLPTPRIQTHRGGVNVFPENTMEAFRAMVGAGAQALNFDVWLLTDGGLGVMHDQTVDRTTTATGNITDLDSSAVQQLVVDAGSWFGGSWGNLRVPLIDEPLAEFGNKVFLEVEAKTIAGTGAALVAALQRHGIGTNACRVDSFLLTELAAPVAAGYSTMYGLTAGNHAATPTSTLTNAGVMWVALDQSSADMATQAAKNAEVARWHAAGVKVLIYTCLRRTEIWPWLVAGADEIVCDDPLYGDQANWVPRTTAPFASGNFFSGMIAPGGSASATRGKFVGPIGRARWQQNQGGTNYNFMGPIAPIKGAVDSTLQAATLAGATSIIVGPQNKPIAGKLLTIDPPPGSVTIASSGTGSGFAGGTTYFYQVTAVTASGETGVSRELSTAPTAGQNVVVSGSVPDGATAINVYRGTTTGAENVLVGSATITQVSSTNNTFSLTDTGGAGTAQSPPAGITETVTPAADGVRNADGTYTVAVAALSFAHAAGVRVYGGTWTLATSITFDAIGSDTSRHPDVWVGARDDTKINTGSAATDTAFQAFIRATGAMATANVRRGVATGTAGAATSTAISTPLVLSADLAAGVAITSLPVNAIATAIAIGQKFVLPDGQTATATATAAISATAVTVASITPATLCASGSSLPQQVPITVQRTQTQMIFTRVDTATAITISTTDFFGGYPHFGRTDASSGMLTSHSLTTVT